MTDDEIREIEKRFSAGVLAKARKLRGKLRSDEQFPDAVWWVTGSTGAQYRVQLYSVGDALPAATCTCPHGLNTSIPVCSHVAAVLLERAHE